MIHFSNRTLANMTKRRDLISACTMGLYHLCLFATMWRSLGGLLDVRDTWHNCLHQCRQHLDLRRRPSIYYQPFPNNLLADCSNESELRGHLEKNCPTGPSPDCQPTVLQANKWLLLSATKWVVCYTEKAKWCTLSYKKKNKQKTKFLKSKIITLGLSNIFHVKT